MNSSRRHSGRPVPPVDFAPRPLERVEAELVELAGQIAAATARFVRLVGEFDAAEGWRDWGMTSTAHWLSWRCGVDLHSAREQVRVARALQDLPATAAAFAAGRLTYSKVRALTRFVTSETEADGVVTAEHCTAAHLERLASAVRRGRKINDVRRRQADRSVTWRGDTDGSLVGSFRLPPEDAALLVRALDALRGRLAPLGSEGSAGEAPASPAANAADALVEMAKLALDVPAGTSPAAAERVQLVIHSTAESLARADDVDDIESAPAAELEDGTRLHPATARLADLRLPDERTDHRQAGRAAALGPAYQADRRSASPRGARSRPWPVPCAGVHAGRDTDPSPQALGERRQHLHHEPRFAVRPASLARARGRLDPSARRRSGVAARRALGARGGRGTRPGHTDDAASP